MNKSWDISKDGGQEDQKNIVYGDADNDGKIDNLNEEDLLHLRDGLVDNNNDDVIDHTYIEHGGVINQQDEQENRFGGADSNPQT